MKKSITQHTYIYTCHLKCFKLDWQLTIELSTHATLDMPNSNDCWSFTKAGSYHVQVFRESQVFDITNVKDFQQWRPAKSYGTTGTDKGGGDTCRSAF